MAVKQHCNIKIFSEKKLRIAGNQTWGWWMGSTNATSVLRSPPDKAKLLLAKFGVYFNSKSKLNSTLNVFLSFPTSVVGNKMKR